MKKIIFKTNTGVAIVTPTNAGLTIFGIEGIAQRDIPRILPIDKEILWGKGEMSREEYSTYPLPEYKIIEEEELPQDWTYRDAWTYELTIDPLKKEEIDSQKSIN